MTRDETPPKGYLAMTFGPSTVTGNFSDDDFFNRFAKRGYQYSILEFGYKFIPNFGLTASIKGAIIPQDVQALADGFAEEYGGQFTVTSTRWGYTAFFVGPFGSIPTKFVDFDFRLLTGLLFAECPEVIVTRDAETVAQKSGFGGSLALQTGIGARIHLTRKFGLITQAEYHISNPIFDFEYYDNNNNYGIETGSKKLTMFNFSFGIAYRIF
jgi:hypothetical protein